MPLLPPEIYLPIAATLLATVGLLWKRMSDLYTQLLQDSHSMETIADLLTAAAGRDARVLQALDLLMSRLESLRSSNVSPQAGH